MILHDKCYGHEQHVVWLWKLCWFSGFLLITAWGLLFRFLGDDAYFLFWRFALCNWPTWSTSPLLGYRLLDGYICLIYWFGNHCHYLLLSVSLDLQRHFVKESLINLNACYQGFGSYHIYKDNCSSIITRIICVFYYIVIIRFLD